MSSSSVEVAVEALRAAVDGLLDLDLSTLAGVEVSELLSLVEVQRRRCEAVDQQLVGELDQRGTAGEFGRASTIDLLIELLRVSPREARARVVRARDLGPRRSLTGEPLGPILPATATAQAAGEISAEHASVIVRALEQLPAQVDAQAFALVEAALVEQAGCVHAGQVAKAAQVLLARIDQDGAEPRERELQRRRGYGIAISPRGGGTPYGRFTPELCAVWGPILDALSAPRTEGGPGAGDQEGQGGQGGQGGSVEPDDRTPAQRRHDALLEAGLRLLRSGTLPDSGGTPVTVLLHAREDQLREQAAPEQGQTAVTGHGELIGMSELKRLAGEALVTSVVFDPTGGILNYGQRRRLASCGQRQALAARDKGCSFPGCTRPPAWCEAHHVIPWWDNGPTNLSNLVLLCAWHHREFERRGWQVRIRNGVPEWIPPPWLDQAQRPRRNTAHHPKDIDLTGSYPDTG